MLDVDPSAAYAVVVGIDYYKYGDAWNLVGPSRDALKIVDLLIARGVPAENIALFLSSRSWKDEHVVTWMNSFQYPLTQHHATSETLRAYFRCLADKLEASPQKAGSLLVYWGGHGATDPDGKHWILFTADADRGAPECLSVSDMLRATGSTIFEKFSNQVFIIDACTSHYGSIKEKVAPAITYLHKSQACIGVSQLQIYSASGGLRAAEDKENQYGVFSELLISTLARRQNLAKNDFIEAFRSVSSHEELRGQLPVIYESGDQRQLHLPGDGAGAMDLWNLIDKLAVSPRGIRRAYLRTLPATGRAIEDNGGWKCIQHLSQLPNSDYGVSRLIEFAERLGQLEKKMS